MPEEIKTIVAAISLIVLLALTGVMVTQTVQAKTKPAPTEVEQENR